MAERKLPDDPLSFIRECVRGGRIFWTYHVNMRLGRRFIVRETIIQATESYEIVEASQKINIFRAICFWENIVMMRSMSCLAQMSTVKTFESSRRIIPARKNGRRI